MRGAEMYLPSSTMAKRLPTLRAGGVAERAGALSRRSGSRPRARRCWSNSWLAVDQVLAGDQGALGDRDRRFAGLRAGEDLDAGRDAAGDHVFLA